MSLILVGTNHKYCPVEVRERIAFTKSRLSDALTRMARLPFINTAAILSTCNRVELYANSQGTQPGIWSLKRFLSDYHNVGLEGIEPYLYTYKGEDAIQHLFSVASGLDSQILGEGEIAQQVGFSHEKARSLGVTNDYLDAVFEKAIKCASRIKDETGISNGNISIASVVAELIKSRCGTIRDKKILIIGVGKVSELVVKYLKGEKMRASFIANRTYERACELARHIGAQVVRFDHLKEKLLEADIVISACATPHPILKAADLKTIGRKILVIDLAVPRNVEPEATHIEGVELFSLDDLDFIIERNLESRKNQLPGALKIIEREVEAICYKELSELEREPVLSP